MTLFEFDADVREERGAAHLCGVDEAGRGPLAGPVYAAAVILSPGVQLAGLDDSKKLTARKREALFGHITAGAAAWCVAQADVGEIEALNVLKAALLAMSRAVKGLGLTPDFVLIDGDKLPETGLPMRAVVGGDKTSAAIAAASILAKVSRDRHMAGLAAQYPQYGFERHKGYGTKAHYAALDAHGPCPVHRRSFLKNWEASR